MDLPPPYYIEATAYCLQGRMADGSSTRAGSVAHNGYSLGTKLTINGQRYVVRDRIGYGTSLDIWMPTCGAAIAFGRRVVKVREGWWERQGRVVKIHVRLPGKVNPQLGTAIMCWKARGLRRCVEAP